MKRLLEEDNYKDVAGFHKISVPVLSYFDKNDNYHYFAAPTLDVIGVGKTESEAKESFEIVLAAFIKSTSEKKSIINELFKLGWEINLLKKKPFFAQGPSINEIRNNPDWADVWKKEPKVFSREVMLAF